MHVLKLRNIMLKVYWNNEKIWKFIQYKKILSRTLFRLEIRVLLSIEQKVSLVSPAYDVIGVLKYRWGAAS